MANYTIQPRKGYSPEKYDQYEIRSGTQFIGWAMFSKGRIPFVHITADSKTKIDKHALAVEIKKRAGSEGEYFVVELVHFKDLEPKTDED